MTVLDVTLKASRGYRPVVGSVGDVGAFVAYRRQGSVGRGPVVGSVGDVVDVGAFLELFAPLGSELLKLLGKLLIDLINDLVIALSSFDIVIIVVVVLAVHPQPLAPPPPSSEIQSPHHDHSRHSSRSCVRFIESYGQRIKITEPTSNDWVFKIETGGPRYQESTI